MQTKKLTRREIVWMTWPLLVLVAVGFLWRRGGESLTFEKAEVLTLTPQELSQGAYFCFHGIDTRIAVTVKYNQPSLYKQFTTELSQKDFKGEGYLVDENGRKYTHLLIGGDMILFGAKLCEVHHVGLQRYRLEFGIPLSAIPQSAGVLTLKGNITVNGTYTLPISVVVRD